MNFKAWTSGLDRFARSVSFFFLVLSVVASFFVVKLYANLKPDVEELLPTESRSVKDLSEVTSRMRSIDSLAVLLFSQNAQAVGNFQEALAKKLAQLPPEVSAGVEYKISEELAFFEKRKSLFIAPHDLNDIHDYIRDRINYEKFIYNPLNLVIENKPLEPEYDFAKLASRYSSRAEEYSHFPGGVYSTPDGQKRLILINAPNQSNQTAHAMKKAVEAAVKDLRPSSFAPDLKVLYTGSVEDIIEEQAALMEDLALSTILVTVFVSLMLWIYYRSFMATFALIASLLVGTLITFGISYFTVGYLNANSAFLGSIVMGNGINFGIMILARYLEERRSKQQTHLAALSISLEETFIATLTAALAAGLSYGSLMLTSFRGFSQFGVIGFTGMVACWISAYTFFPAFLSFLNRHFDLVGKDRRTESRGLWGHAIKWCLSKHAKLIVVFGILITVASGIGLSRLNRDMLETDLTKLRDKRSMEEGSGYFSTYVDLILKRYGSPLAVLAHNPKESAEIAKKLEGKKEAEGESSLIDSIMRIQDFIPADQAEKIRILKSTRALLPPKLYWHLSGEQKAQIEAFTSKPNLTPFGLKDLPPKLLEKFKEKNGQIGNLILVEPPMSGEVRNGQTLVKFVKEIRETVDAVGPGIPVAGRLPVTADMIEAIVREGPLATLVSGLAVVMLTLLLFRNWKLSGLVLGSLFLGVMWMIGAMADLNLKINFLNFIALPITFGIGVDYAVNVFARYREELKVLDPRSAIIRASYHTGGAVVLASISTIIGWGSLLIAGNQAFVSFGKLAVLGEITCVTVAVLIIPATLIVLRKSQTRA